MRVESFGEAAYLVTPEPGSVRSTAAAIAAAGSPGVVDVVVGAETVLVLVDGEPERLAALRRWLEAIRPGRAAIGPEGAAIGPEGAAVGPGGAAIRPGEDAAPHGRQITLEVDYDGPDLGDVADRVGLSVEEVVGRHSAGRYTVAHLGFIPGFAYLDGLDTRLALPRLNRPRVRVPAGSVGIAAAQTCVYPASTPGGWRLLGRTSAVLFDVARQPPALLAVGDRVRFVVAGATGHDAEAGP